MKVLVVRWCLQWWGQTAKAPPPQKDFVTHLRGEELDKILLMTERFE